LVVVVAVLAASCASPQTDGPRPTTAPVATAIAPVAVLDWPARFEAGGTVTARTTAFVSSRVVAPIATVGVRAGDRVTRGQVLVTLETAELSAAAARAASAVDAARQAVDAAAADVRSADAALQLARAAHHRMVTLHAQKSATPQELDEATATLAMADARASAVQARAREASSSLDAARAAAVAAETTASYGTLAAPFDGVVTERSADPGTMAAPGRTLVTLEDQGTFTLDVRLDASRAASVRRQDVVAVQIGADPAPWTSGRVTEIARVDPSAQSFLVKIGVPAATGLRSGLFGRARFSAGVRRTLVVPTAALSRRGQLVFVFVLTERQRGAAAPRFGR
jgi:RND family efflux transporter MFP subunit